MKNIKELPITVQMALAIKTPELFNKKEFERLMKVKNVVMKEMYKEYVKKLGQLIDQKDERIKEMEKQLLKYEEKERHNTKQGKADA